MLSFGCGAVADVRVLEHSFMLGIGNFIHTPATTGIPLGLVETAASFGNY